MLVLVMLTNIYIGVMGNAYNHNQAKALELFVRARAAICLDISLQYPELQAWWRSRNDPHLQDDDEDGLQRWTVDSEGEGSLFQGEGRVAPSAKFRHEYVWFCRADPDYCPGTRAEDTSTTSEHQVRELQKAVEKVQRNMQQLQHLPGQAQTASPGSTPRKSHSCHVMPEPLVPRVDMPLMPSAIQADPWSTKEEEELASH